VKNIETQQELEKVLRLQDFEQSLYAQHRDRTGSTVETNKANDAKLISELAQIIQN
jgi:hypothetical protein